MAAKMQWMMAQAKGAIKCIEEGLVDLAEHMIGCLRESLQDTLGMLLQLIQALLKISSSPCINRARHESPFQRMLQSHDLIHISMLSA